MGIIVDIIRAMVEDVLVFAILWITAVVIWIVILPVALVVLFPVMCLIPLFRKGEYVTAFKTGYLLVFDYWTDLGLKILQA